MLLSDRSLRARMDPRAPLEPWQRIRVTPLRAGATQPCSLDVHLAGPLKIYTGARTDTRRDNSPWWQEHPIEFDPGWEGLPTQGWVLQPNHFYLAVLDEWIAIPEDVCGQVHGVSSRARDGIVVHQQAGLLDPGWAGRATLEITVASPHTVLYPGQRIAQVTFELLDGRCETPYHGRYQGDLDARPARLREGVAV